MSQPPGLLALGCQGSACDRLRLTGGLRAPALGSYIVSLRWRGTALSGAISYAAFGGENHTTALTGVGNASPFGGWRHMDKPLWGLKVQAPLGARGFYRSCAAHRTMGSAHRAGWFRGEFYMPLPGAAKTFTTALRVSEMHPPFGGWRHHLPPAERWDNKALQSSSFISGSQHNGAL